MKSFYSLIVFLTIAASLSGQQTEDPEGNPDNSLDMKVLIQDYLRITGSGRNRRVEEDSYLLLKLNDRYLQNDNTGMNRSTLKKYLSNCEPAFDLSMKGVNTIGRSKTMKNISTWGSYALYLGAAVYGYRFFSNESNDNRNIALACLGAGFLTQTGFNVASKRLKRKGHNQVIEAMNQYKTLCYKPELNPDYDPTGTIPNGQSNKYEKILINVLSNNPKAIMLSVGPQASASFISDFNYGLGAGVSAYFRGFYFSATAERIFQWDQLDLPFSTDLNEYNWRLDGSIPIFGKQKQKPFPIEIGASQGIEFTAESDQTKLYSAFGADVGLQRIQQYSLDNEVVADHYVKNTIARAGVSLTGMTHLSYKIGDNRFKSKTRTTMSMYRIY